MIQVKATPMMAWFSPKRKLLMGLQTTTYRSMARTTRDHKAISPARQSAISQHATCLDPTVCLRRLRTAYKGGATGKATWGMPGVRPWAPLHSRRERVQGGGVRTPKGGSNSQEA